MANRNKTATKTNGKEPAKKESHSLTRPTSIAYEAAKHGINSSALARAATSEIFCVIGSQVNLDMAAQAHLMLNAIGKMATLANAEMRWGSKKREFFLNA